jgi:hypothetical protein
MTTITIARYRFFEGPGHAWLEIPADEVTRDMGISRYSWQHGSMYYLEEDVDVMRFLRAKYGPHFTWRDLQANCETVNANAPGYRI